MDTTMRPVGPPAGLGAGETLALRDGTVVHLRMMGADDGERLVRFHATLSPESQYLRFFSNHSLLSEREVTWFTHVDHCHRDAFVVVLDGEIVGVGRLDRVPGRGDAEVAFVVTDAFQGQGLGGALLRRIIARADELGVDRLVADTLLVNHRMLAVFHHCGLAVATSFEDGVVHVTMTVRGDAAPD
jgi:RimJ/RimL family protein N-acetyltransferase